MRKDEKKDLILKELYQLRHENEYQSLRNMAFHANIPFRSFHGLALKARKLQKAGLIKLKVTDSQMLAIITPEGIDFRETTPYAYPGYPIIPNL